MRVTIHLQFSSVQSLSRSFVSDSLGSIAARQASLSITNSQSSLKLMSIKVNKAEIDVFLELSCFFHDPADVGNLISGSSAFSKTEIRLIIFFAAKDGEALYSQPKQDQELTVAQTMNSLLPNSDLN